MVAVSHDVVTVRVPHVPDLQMLVGLARRAGASSDQCAIGLVGGALQLFAEQWSDAVRIRMVAAAPVDVARWLVPPRRPDRQVAPTYTVSELSSALAEECGCSPTVARGTLMAILRALAEVLPPDAWPATD